MYWLLILLHRIQCDCEMNIYDFLLYIIIFEQQLRQCVTIYTLHLLRDVNFPYRLWNFGVSSFSIFVNFFFMFALFAWLRIELNYFSAFFLDSFIQFIYNKYVSCTLDFGIRMYWIRRIASDCINWIEPKIPVCTIRLKILPKYGAVIFSIP